MKNLFQSQRLLRVVGLMALCVHACAVMGEKFREELHKTFSFDHNGTIEVANVNGRIRIQSWDRPEVSVSAVKTADKQADLEAVKIEIESKRDTLVIQAKYPASSATWFKSHHNSARVDFDLNVPREAVLKRITNVNGTIDIERFEGPVTASTVNGSLRVTGLAADASLSTVNGGLDVAFASFNKVGSISLETVNGNTSLTIPKDADVTIRVTTVNGKVSADKLIQLNKKSSKRDYEGIIGSGRARAEIRTVNGAVSIRVSPLIARDHTDGEPDPR